MMATILSSAIIIDPAILGLNSDSILVLSWLKLTHSWLNLMMAAIMNSAKLDSDTAILNSDTLLSYLRFTQKHSDSTLTLTASYLDSIWLILNWFSLNLMMAAKKLHSFILTQLDFCHLGFSHLAQNLWLLLDWDTAILDSAILHKKNFTHSFWLNLMMVDILDSAILDADTAILDSNILLSSLRFTQKHSSSTLILAQTNSISLT